jgi:hypothetical protein
MKDEKELKPASMRVRDAAESLLTIILEQVRIICLFLFLNMLINKLYILGWVFSICLRCRKSIMFIR